MVLKINHGVSIDIDRKFHCVFSYKNVRWIFNEINTWFNDNNIIELLKSFPIYRIKKNKSLPSENFTGTS